MRFATERFGEIEIDEGDILSLPSGIIGFPDCTKVVLLDHRENSPFRWLQSVDDPSLAFVVLDPFLIAPDYPAESLRAGLPEKGKNADELAVAAIATIPPAPAPITVNLVAPIVFDAKARIGAQVILHDPRFKTRHMLVRKDETEATEDNPS
ncbi:MAG: flagellar assembly protein FliW [Myxococcota bacterium]|nr:flagellar assembly protein FliW [Myxococcota bacterium]